MKPAKTYGTVTDTAATTDGNGAHHSSSVDEEQQPLIGNGHLSPKSSWKARLNENINRERADWVLLSCYIITGLLDSASISTWGSFVSMQTGNTVYIGLGLASPSTSTRWIKSLTSLASFCVGSFLFARFHRHLAPSPSKRWILILSFLIQTVFILIAASILTFIPSPSDNPSPTTNAIDITATTAPSTSLHWTVLLPITLIALQSSGQAVTSRALKYPALTSVVLTSLYCDLFSDAKLFDFTNGNVERNRRVAAPVLLLIGAVLGGVGAGWEGFGTAGVLWVAAGLKVGVVLAWVLWRGEDDA